MNLGQIKIYFINIKDYKMNCLAGSDSEFTEQLKLLNRQQLEDLGVVFQRRYEILRQAYQNSLRYPPTVPLSVSSPSMVVEVPTPTQTFNNSSQDTLSADQIIIPQSPRGRRSPRRRSQPRQ